MEISLGLAFIAGVISFVSPCVLALVPVYLAYMGDAAGDLAVASASAGRAGVAGIVRHPLVAQVALFSLSFGIIFVLLGTSAGLIGSAMLRTVPSARQVAGVLVIGLGLVTTGAFGPIVERFAGWTLTDRLPTARSGRSIMLGGLFALGWSPCIGPVLGAILAMGATTQQAGAAALLLSAYSAGLAIPFLLVAAGLPRLEPVMQALRRWHRSVQVASGLLIVGMGVLIFFNAFARMAGLFTWFV